MKIKSNINAIKDRARKAFLACVDAYDAANQQAIETPRQWPSGFGTTHRRNGEVVVGSYRNIVDLGNLQASQKVEVLSDGISQFTWDGKGETPVALVHEGHATKGGGYVPARRWTAIAAAEARLGEVFKDNF
jgi:hypothetical protein